MNIKQLKEVIKDLPDNMEVVIQTEREYEFDPLKAVPLVTANSNVIYQPKRGNAYLIEWSAEEACWEEEDWEELKTQPKSLLLSGTNFTT